VLRHRERLGRLDVPEAVLLVEPAEPAGDDLGPEGAAVEADVDATGYDAVWFVRAPFGPYPPELAGTYPLNAEVPARMDPAGRAAAARGVARLADEHPDLRLGVAHRGWPARALEALPEGVETRELTEGEA
jgi:7-cyano-7-deazaguanine tRNA-ribosyltransferase